MKPMKRKILSSLAALSLLFGVASMQGAHMGQGFGGHYGNGNGYGYGHEYGYGNGYGYGYGYPSYGYGPSIVGPAYIGNPYGYGYDGYGDDDWFDDWSGFSLPPPAPNPIGSPKTIEIPSDRAQHHG
jgi:hypothetical protein